ncbi:hypothetical protein [Allorhodopirellula heiligendammensis]|uniref:Uncharacterized protein n=1 Tax=Allorhodopirellula heiligendammensis TaxID=2714739 RepID=A0A5C6C1K2_9BACT|nr:hypothetical protein [Allorhodopirellula heiligendammensis]TWU17995.1 hypothetical protein Poly21_01480 [Allorhodopirellula heiligendammensis]
MPTILLRTINLGGTIYRRGVDIADIATPGEIESLRSGGFIASEGDDIASPSEPDPTPEPTPAVEPDPVSTPSDPPADPPKMFGLHERVIKLLAEADPPILTEDDAIEYGIKHDEDFSAIKGIGDATSDDIVKAIKASLA